MRPKLKDRHLPSCVYEKHGAFYYVKKGKWTKIGTDLQSALQEYAHITSAPENGLPKLIDKALPHICAKVSESTKKQYIFCARRLQAIFAEFRADQVRHGDIVQMLDAYADKPSVGNRLLTVLKLTYQWAMDRQVVEQNPCVSVKRLSQPSRDRLITAAEYAAIYKNCPPWMKVVMDLCYLTGQRIGDVLKIEYTHLLDEGIFIEQQKTGKKLVIAWTPELRAVIASAKDSPNTIRSMRYVVSGRAGTMRAHTNVWRTFKTAARQAGLPDVTLHDLRAMSGTEADREGKDATKLLGHTDRRTTQIYLRDRSAKLVSGPTKKAG